MRRFNLNIECENAAFGSDGALSPLASAGPEVARLLREAAFRIEEGGAEFGTLTDFNGNAVGQFEFAGEWEDPAEDEGDS